MQVVEQRAHEVEHLLREHQRAQVPAAASVARRRQSQLLARLVGDPDARAQWNTLTTVRVSEYVAAVEDWRLATNRSISISNERRGMKEKEIAREQQALDVLQVEDEAEERLVAEHRARGEDERQRELHAVGERERLEAREVRVAPGGLRHNARRGESLARALAGVQREHLEELREHVLLQEFNPAEVYNAQVQSKLTNASSLELQMYTILVY